MKVSVAVFSTSETRLVLITLKERYVYVDKLAKQECRFCNLQYVRLLDIFLSAWSFLFVGKV